MNSCPVLWEHEVLLNLTVSWMHGRDHREGLGSNVFLKTDDGCRNPRRCVGSARPLWELGEDGLLLSRTKAHADQSRPAICATVTSQASPPGHVLWPRAVASSDPLCYQPPRFPARCWLGTCSLSPQISRRAVTSRCTRAWEPPSSPWPCWWSASPCTGGVRVSTAWMWLIQLHSQEPSRHLILKQADKVSAVVSFSSLQSSSCPQTRGWCSVPAGRTELLVTAGTVSAPHLSQQRGQILWVLQEYPHELLRWHAWLTESPTKPNSERMSAVPPTQLELFQLQ